MNPVAAQLHTLVWWTPREVAGRWRVTLDVILQKISTGEINAARIGRQDRIHESEVRRLDRKVKAA